MEVLSEIELSKWVHMDLRGLVLIECQEKKMKYLKTFIEGFFLKSFL
jgi:hypothetical protein